MNTLYVYPDGRRMLKFDDDIPISEMQRFREALEAWKPGSALAVNGRYVEVVNVEPSVEDRLVAIEERLGMRPVKVLA